MTSVTKFGNVGRVSPDIAAFVNSQIAAAVQPLVTGVGPSITNGNTLYSDTSGKKVKSAPYTMPTTVGTVGQVLEVDAGGNIVYGTGGGGGNPTYLSTLTVTNLSQGPSNLVQNYTFPKYAPFSDSVLGSNTASGFTITIPTNSSIRFSIDILNPIATVIFYVPLSAGTYTPDDLSDALMSRIRAELTSYNVIADIFIDFDISIQKFGILVRPGSVNLNFFIWSQYISGNNNNDLFGLDPSQIILLPTSNTPQFANNIPPFLNTAGDLVWRSVAKNQIESDNGESVIECSDLSGIISYGNYNLNNGSLNNIGNINALDNCNITTGTTQIVNGLGELNININSLPRITQNAIKTKLECGTSRLQLAADSDLLTDDTTTYFASQNVGLTKNMAIAISPDTLLLNQDYGAVSRLIVDDGRSALFSKNALSGPTGSNLSLNDDSTFSLSTYFAGNGAIECTANSMAIVGPQAKSSCVYTDATITSSLFNGTFTANREIMDSTSQTFKDGNQVDRIKLDNTDVTINGVYTLPTTAGVDGQVLTRSTGISSIWSTPQIYGLYSQTGTQTVANTSVETTLIGAGVGSLSIPANFFTTGMAFRYNTGGLFRDQNNGQVFRFRLRNGGVLFDSGLLTLQNITTPTPWNIEVVFVYTGGTQLITNFNFQFNVASDARGFTTQNTNNTLDITIPNTLNFTVQWSSSLPNNTITSNYGVLQKIY